MIKKVVFITDFFFNKRDYDRFGIEILQKNFSVEVWDVAQLIYPHFQKDKKGYNEIPRTDLKILNNRDDLTALLSCLDAKTLLIPFFDLTHRTSFLFREISGKGLKYAVIQMMTFPDPDEGKNNHTDEKTFRGLIRRLYRKLKGFRLHDVPHYYYRLVRQLNRQWLYAINGISPADYVILTGSASAAIRKYPIDPKRTSFIWTHTLDYDLYFMMKDDKTERKAPYAVFLDEDYLYHKDFETILESSSPFTPEEYYSKMQAFFNHVERETGLPVIIAAHPRSEHLKLEELERLYRKKVIRGQTPQLVRDCSLVIAHMSTAINFAILFQKPILFVTTDKLERMVSGKFKPGIYIATVARALNQTPVNADHPASFDTVPIFSIDKKAYHDYRQAYIKMDGTPDKPFWEIVSSFISGKTSE